MVSWFIFSGIICVLMAPLTGFGSPVFSSWSQTVSEIMKITKTEIQLVITAINGWAKMYKKCAERDGKIDCGEKVGMAINSFSSGVMTIVDFAMLIWGSVVVFGAYANWTDNWDTYKDDPEVKNFCENTPMMTAFVILILKWVICPQDTNVGCYTDDVCRS